MPISEGPVWRFTRVCFGVLSSAGLIISIWAQAISIFGLDPRDYFQQIWIVEPSLTLALLPLVITLVRKGGFRNNPFDLPLKARRLVLLLMGYYVFQFYRFLYRAAVELRSHDTWQMFSAGWIVLFSLAVLCYFKPSTSERASADQSEQT